MQIVADLIDPPAYRQMLESARSPIAYVLAMYGAALTTAYAREYKRVLRFIHNEIKQKVVMRCACALYVCVRVCTVVCVCVCMRSINIASHMCGNWAPCKHSCSIQPLNCINYQVSYGMLLLPGEIKLVQWPQMLVFGQPIRFA